MEEWDELTEEECAQLQIRIVALLDEHQEFLRNEKERGVVELDQSRMGRLARIDAIQNQQAAKKQVRRIEKEILVLIVAEKRLRRDPDNFGFCIDCDERIPLQRLLYRPFERKCVPCAQNAGL